MSTTTLMTKEMNSRGNVYYTTRKVEYTPMAKSTVTSFSTGDFAWNAAAKTLSANASDLGIDGAMPFVITVTSAHTGKTLRFETAYRNGNTTVFMNGAVKIEITE